tara:strand:+ start:4050 stop:4784 length:735 start_codon:yes stop_codon:yes gene_type:complete
MASIELSNDSKTKIEEKIAEINNDEESESDDKYEVNSNVDVESTEEDKDLKEDDELDELQTDKENTIIIKKPRRKKEHMDIYHNTMITKNLSVPINNIGKNLSETLENIIRFEYEGKCISEGYVKPNSTKILTYSSGLVNSDSIIFEVVLECMICLPVEGMHINCNIKNITRAGIRAETEESPSPIVVFVARDHSTNSKYNNLVENQEIIVRVIGQRFELNDKYISIIAELIGVTNKKKRIKIR